MNRRPVYTLEEDFRRLGLLSEMEDAKPDPKVKKIQRKEQTLAKQKAKLAKQKMSVGMEDVEEDDGDLDEARMMRVRKMRGVKAMKAKKASKRYYKKHKAAAKRLRKTAKYQRRRKKLSKMKKGPKGYRRMLNMSSENSMESIGNVIDALAHESKADQFSTAFSNVSRLATALSEQYGTLGEEYMSSNVNFNEVAQCCAVFAEEANMWVEALDDHDDEDIRVRDQELIKEQFADLLENVSEMLDMYEDYEAIIAIDEGLMDEEDDFEDDEDLEEAVGHAMFSMPAQEHGEHQYSGPVKGWKNAEVHSPGHVMNPLGLEMGLRKLSDDEKETLAAQKAGMTGLGYGLGLGTEPY